jgi:hypothetical protein
MAENGPKVGGLSVAPWGFDLWPFDELEEINKGYETQKCVPGFWGFGSNGAGELFAFDQAGQIFMIPFIPMDAKSAVKIADSWMDFQSKTKK